MRIRALIKRSLGEVSKNKIQMHDLSLDSSTQTIIHAGQHIELPRIQFKLLQILMRNSPSVITKQEIIIELWGDEEPESAVAAFRRKILQRPPLDACYGGQEGASA